MAGEPLDLLKGTLDVLILKALSWGPMHGFGVSHWIRRRTGGRAGGGGRGALQALHGSSGKGLVQAPGAPPRTTGAPSTTSSPPRGGGTSARRRSTWRRYVAAVAAVLDAASRDPAPDPT
jgi:hypothetical protein